MSGRKKTSSGAAAIVSAAAAATAPPDHPTHAPLQIHVPHAPHAPHAPLKCIVHTKRQSRRQTRQLRSFSDEDNNAAFVAHLNRQSIECLVCRERGWSTSNALAPVAKRLMRAESCGHALCLDCAEALEALDSAKELVSHKKSAKRRRSSNSNAETVDSVNSVDFTPKQATHCAFCKDPFQPSLKPLKRPVARKAPESVDDCMSQTFRGCKTYREGVNARDTCPCCNTNVWIAVPQTVFQDVRVTCPQCHAAWCFQCKCNRPRHSNLPNPCACSSEKKTSLPERWSRRVFGFVLYRGLKRRFAVRIKEAQQRRVICGKLCSARNLTLSDASRAAAPKTAKATFKDTSASNPTPHLHACVLCETYLEKTAACNELVHCGVSMCNVCGDKSLPWETHLPPEHFAEVSDSHLLDTPTADLIHATTAHLFDAPRRCARWDSQVPGVLCREGVCCSAQAPCTSPLHAESRARLEEYRKMQRLKAARAERTA